MPYYIMLEEKRGEYSPLDISRSKYFKADSAYKKEGACTLSEIDLFTTCFENEDELRLGLLKENILSVDNMNKKLSIRVSTRGNYNRFSHDFLYKNDLDYIMNPDKLIDNIMKRYYANNWLFIQKLANNFVNFYECGCTASEVSDLITLSIKTRKRNYQLDLIDENGDNLVRRLLKLLVFKYSQNSMTGRIEYKREINYRNLHCLITFVNSYDKQVESFIKEDIKVRKRTL